MESATLLAERRESCLACPLRRRTCALWVLPATLRDAHLSNPDDSCPISFWPAEPRKQKTL